METKKTKKALMRIGRPMTSKKHVPFVTPAKQPIALNPGSSPIVSAPITKKYKITFEVMSEEVGEALIALGAVNATITGIEEKGKEGHEA